MPKYPQKNGDTPAADSVPMPVGPRALAGLAFTAFAANGFIMTLELVAGRLTARYLGQSLYTWTTIIACVLAGMSIGAVLAGRLADRDAPLRLLSKLLFASGLACVSVLLLNEMFGRFPLLQPLPWLPRIVVHMLGTFLIPSIFLGSITPVLLRHALRAGGGSGRIIGIIYAASALGSVAGTFGAGFVLIPNFGTRLIVIVSALGLGALALAFAWASRSEKPLSGSATPSESATVTGSRPPAWYAAIVAVFISNASFMILELAASRLATHQLGHSIYTWTSLLGIVLAGVMIGNYAGGRLSDYIPIERLLPRLFALGAVLPLIALPVHRWLVVGPLFDEVGWIARTFLHILIAFFVPSAALGAIGPAAARNAIHLSRNEGRTIGIVYATGALGSVTGTLLTGYLLIDHLWPIGTVFVLSAGLALCAITFGRSSPAAWAAAAIVVATVSLGALPIDALERRARSLGLREADGPEFAYRDHSNYSWIAVNRSPVQQNRRVMYLDQLLHATVDVEAPTNLRYEYQQIYAGVVDVLHTPGAPIRANIIGGGGYVYPRYLEITRPGSYIEAIEIDPDVTEAAFHAFGLPRDTNIQIHNKDARNRFAELARNPSTADRFDVIYGDSFNQYSVPFQLATLEFNEYVSELLSDRGVYLFNLIDSLDRGAFLSSVVRTCRLTFPHVYVMSSGPADIGRDTYVVASSKVPLDMREVLTNLRKDFDFQGLILSDPLLDQLIDKNRSPVLTDDFAPVDNMVGPLLATKETARIGKLRQHAIDLIDGDRVDEAIPLLESLHTQAPEDLEPPRNLALIHARRGDLDRALPYFLSSVRIAPKSHELRYNLGLLYTQLGENEKALEQLRVAAELEPGDAKTQHALGSVYIALNRIEEALSALTKATELNPDNASGHYMLGNAQAHLKQFDDAIESFERSIELQPTFREAQYNLAKVHLAREDYPRMRRQLAETLEQDPSDPIALYMFGLSYEGAGNTDEALRYYDLAVEVRPDFRQAREAAARLRNP